MEYMMVNGYQIPALTLNEPPMPEIGKYGSLRRKFLLENAPMMFDEMMLEGTLYPHLVEMQNGFRQKMNLTTVNPLPMKPPIWTTCRQHRAKSLQPTLPPSKS